MSARQRRQKAVSVREGTALPESLTKTTGTRLNECIQQVRMKQKDDEHGKAADSYPLK